jgi:hypothetical protein
MTQFYGYRCYSPDRQPLGWLYTNAKGGYAHTNDRADLYVCKRWKTHNGAAKHFDSYNQQWQLSSEGYLQIEVMPESSPPHQARLKTKEWDAANPEFIKKSRAKYDLKCPILSFRPTSEIIKWLEEERYCDDGIPETNAALVNRKLEKLRQMENQGY